MVRTGQLKLRKILPPSLVVILLMGVKRLGKTNHLLSDEKKIAEWLGMEKFFDQSVAHEFLNAFHHSPVDQLDKISTELLRENGESFRQDIIVLDKVRTKLGRRRMIIRVEGGYFAAPIWDCVVEEGLQGVMSARYDWIMAQGHRLDNRKWHKKEAPPQLYDLGYVKVLLTTEKKFRVVWVEKQQEPFPGSKSKKKILHYTLVENLLAHLSPAELFDFYHEHQTIENHFKESDGPFNSGKMPAQKFQAHRAFLQFVVIAENCFTFFKKTFFPAPGQESRLKLFAIR